jgi:hypothetical protein
MVAASSLPTPIDLVPLFPLINPLYALKGNYFGGDVGRAQGNKAFDVTKKVLGCRMGAIEMVRLN